MKEKGGELVKKAMTFLMLALCVLLAGCGSQTPSSESEPETAAVQTVPETLPWGSVSLNLQQREKNQQFHTVKADNLEITLQASCWSPERAESFARQVFRFRDAVAEFMPLAQGRIYAGDHLTPDRLTSQLFLRLTEEDTPQLADYWQIYLLLTGGVQDYGIAYGLVSQLCRELVLCPADAPMSDSVLAQYFSLERNLYLLDLTLPMLENRFFEASTASHARSAAIHLGQFLLEQYGRDALRPEAGQEDFRVQQKNQWLEHIGVTHTYVPFAAVSFVPHTGNTREDYPYVIPGDSADFYFSVKDVSRQGYVRFLSSYLELAELMEADFADARQVLEGYISEDIPAVGIFTRFWEKGDMAGSFYTFDGITLYHDWDNAAYSLLHEYIHYLLHDFMHYNHLMDEALTEEISVYECRNRMQQKLWAQQLSDRTLAQQLGIWDEETQTVDLGAYGDIVAQAYYCSAPGSESYLAISGYTITRPEVITMFDLTYEEAGSFVHYLIGRFGWDAVLEAIDSTEKNRALWGKSFPEMYQDWANANAAVSAGRHRLLLFD